MEEASAVAVWQNEGECETHLCLCNRVPPMLKLLPELSDSPEGLSAFGLR